MTTLLFTYNRNTIIGNLADGILRLLSSVSLLILLGFLWSPGDIIGQIVASCVSFGVVLWGLLGLYNWTMGFFNEDTVEDREEFVLGLLEDLEEAENKLKELKKDGKRR